MKTLLLSLFLILVLNSYSQREHMVAPLQVDDQIIHVAGSKSEVNNESRIQHFSHYYELSSFDVLPMIKKGMHITINDNQLLIESEGNGEKAVFKTTLNDEEKEKIENNYIQELFTSECEWHVCFPSNSKQNYLRLGKIQ